MSRAEEKALEAYPVEIVGYTVECRIGAEPEPLDWTKKFRKCFAEGYEQAEKDLGWHSVEESLPPMDEEVIVLTDELNLDGCYKICFGHIVNPKYVDALECDGWNIPAVKFWMPMPEIKQQ